MEILYSSGCPIACYQLRRQPSELCAHGTMPESSWQPCAAQDQPSLRPTARLGPRPCLCRRFSTAIQESRL